MDHPHHCMCHCKVNCCFLLSISTWFLLSFLFFYPSSFWLSREFFQVLNSFTTCIYTLRAILQRFPLIIWDFKHLMCLGNHTAKSRNIDLILSLCRFNTKLMVNSSWNFISLVFIFSLVYRVWVHTSWLLITWDF